MKTRYTIYFLVLFGLSTAAVGQVTEAISENNLCEVAGGSIDAFENTIFRIHGKVAYGKLGPTTKKLKALCVRLYREKGVKNLAASLLGKCEELCSSSDFPYSKNECMTGCQAVVDVQSAAIGGTLAERWHCDKRMALVASEFDSSPAVSAAETKEIKEVLKALIEKTKDGAGAGTAY